MSRDSDISPEEMKALGITPEVFEKIQTVSEKLQAAKKEAGRAVIGQEQLIEDVIITMMSGGHALLVGVPGLAKTVLAESISKVFGLDDNRVQFTPDTMPSDILGAELVEEDPETKSRSFRYEKGPIHTQFFLADEINRGNTRTQAGLLQAMQEKKVTVGGENHKLPKPFHVLATQNPIEQEGTNELPEAQKDRFLMEINLTYPDRDSEGKIMLQTTTTHHTFDEIFDENIDLDQPANEVVSPSSLTAIFNARQLIGVQHLVRKLPIGEKTYDAILDLVRGARPHMRPLEDGEVETEDLSEIFDFTNDNVEYGPGTRALQAFALATRARALMNGRLSPNVDDVLALADPILRHRVGIKKEAEFEGVDTSAVIQNLTAKYRPG